MSSDMKIKELLDFKISIKGKGKYGARWNSKNLNTEITFFANTFKFRNEEEDFKLFLNDLNIFFLTEYLCACIMRGNHLKRACANKNNKKRTIILILQALFFFFFISRMTQFCIPIKIAAEMLNLRFTEKRVD